MENDASKTPAALSKTPSEILRVLPSRLVTSLTFPANTGPELLAFVSPKTLAQLCGQDSDSSSTTFFRATFKVLAAPIDPMTASSSISTPEPTARVLNPGGREGTSHPNDDSHPGDIYIGGLEGLLSGHLVFTALPESMAEWDLVRWDVSS